MELRNATRFIWLGALLGLLASCYLLYHHFVIQMGLQTGPSLCAVNATFDCDKVARSSYSEFFGIPVAAFGIFYFAFWALMLFRKRGQYSDPETWGLFRFVAVLGLIPAILLLAISISKIGSICLFCLFTYLMSLLIAVCVFRMRDFPAEGKGFYPLVKFLFRGNKAEFDLGNLMVAIVLAAISLIAPSYYLASYRAALPTPTAEEQLQRELRAWEGAPLVEIPVSSSDFIRDGSGGTLVIFSDFGCPACQRVAALVEKLGEEFSTKIVFKNFPLDQSCNRLIKNRMHEHSCRAAEIARCAGALAGQESFWKVHDQFFSLPELTKTEVDSIEEEVSGQIAGFKDCMDSDRELAVIKSDIEIGATLNLQGTPGIFINGKVVARPTAVNLRAILSRTVSKP